MAYVEINLDGKTVARRSVDIDLSSIDASIDLTTSIGSFHITRGEIARIGRYEARLIEDELPETDEALESDRGDASTQDEPEPVPVLKGYEIISKIGEGSGGTVWRAVQVSTRREVALKLLDLRHAASRKHRIRFEREIELSAELEHPNIASVYDSGVHEGFYFYAMQLIEGVPLDRYVRALQLDERSSIKLMQTVCDAVQYAHSRGIIHRDLKPSNVLITTDGHPFVVDFGLAKALVQRENDLEVTRQNQWVGTPAYMSPEQAAARPDLIGTRSDVYSLGVILYRLLVGEFPHELTRSYLDTVRRIAETDARRPRELSRQFNPELEAILLRALAREPEARYTSAGAFSRDLGRYLDGEPVDAKRGSRAYVLRKMIRRHRVPVVLGASAVLLLAVCLAVTSVLYVRAERAKSIAEDARREERAMRTEADRQRDQAIAARDAAQLQSALNGLLLGRASTRRHDFVAAHHALLHAPPLSDMEQDWRWAAWEYFHNARETDWRDLGPAIVARSGSDAGPTSDERTARIDSVARVVYLSAGSQPEVAVPLESTSTTSVTTPAITPSKALDSFAGFDLVLEPLGENRQRMVLSGPDGTWTGERASIHGIRARAVSDDHALLALGLRNGLIEGYRLDEGNLAPVFSIDGYREEFLALAFTPETDRLQGVSADWMFWEWTVADRPDMSTLHAHSDTTRRLEFDPSGGRLASGSYDGHLKVWDVRSETPLIDIPAYAGSRLGVRQVQFTRDGRSLYMTGGDRFLSLWDWRTGNRVGGFEVTDSFTSFALAEDLDVAFVRGGTFESGDIIQQRNLTTGEVEAEFGDLRPHTVVYDLAYEPRAAVLFAAIHVHGQGLAHPAPCEVWDVRTRTKLRAIEFHQDGLRDVEVSPDGTLLAIASRDGTASLWRWSTGERLNVMEVRSGRADTNVISCIRFHPTQPVLVTASHDNRVLFWSTTTGRQLAALSVDEERELDYRLYGALKEVAFSPDGRVLAITVGSDIWLLDMTAFDEQVNRLSAERRALFVPQGGVVLAGDR